jgi:hypothetical protein
MIRELFLPLKISFDFANSFESHIKKKRFDYIRLSSSIYPYGFWKDFNILVFYLWKLQIWLFPFSFFFADETVIVLFPSENQFCLLSFGLSKRSYIKNKSRLAIPIHLSSIMQEWLALIHEGHLILKKGNISHTSWGNLSLFMPKKNSGVSMSLSSHEWSYCISAPAAIK